MRKTVLAAVITSAVVIALGGATALAFGHSGQNSYQNNVAGTTDMVYNQSSNCAYCEEESKHRVYASDTGPTDPEEQTGRGGR